MSTIRASLVIGLLFMTSLGTAGYAAFEREAPQAVTDVRTPGAPEGGAPPWLVPTVAWLGLVALMVSLRVPGPHRPGDRRRARRGGGFYVGGGLGGGGFGGGGVAGGSGGFGGGGASGSW